MKKTSVILGGLTLAVAMMVGAAAPAAATDCTMKFTLKGWAAFYKTASGRGTITCDNGQSMNVRLEAKGGGLTAGKSKVDDGFGKFTEVADIKELLGAYVAANASAGAGKSSEAGVVTKGDISLALAGHGTGIELGISFGKFIIAKR
jgi:hypothetical protein